MSRFFFLLISFLTFFPGLSVDEIREDYKEAIGSEEKTFELKEVLKNVTKSDDNRLVAYKGAVIALSSQYLKGISNKVKTFQEGTAMIEYAVEKAPSDIEIRFVRLSVQQNSPKFLKYNKHIAGDKQFILSNFHFSQEC